MGFFAQNQLIPPALWAEMEKRLPDYDQQAGRSALLLPGRANATQPRVVRLPSTNGWKFAQVHLLCGRMHHPRCGWMHHKQVHLRFGSPSAPSPCERSKLS